MRRQRRSLDREELYESRGEGSVILEPDPEQVRRIRVERLERSANATTGTFAAAPIMSSESHATIPSSKRSSSHHRRRREHHRSPDESKHRRRRESAAKDETGGTYVYEPPRETKEPQVIVSESRVLGRDGDSSESSDSEKPVRRSRAEREKPKERKVKVIYVSAKDEVKSVRSKEHRVREERPRSPGSIRRSSPIHVRRKSAPEPPPASPAKRPPPVRHLHSEIRSPLKRSNTTTSHAPSTRTQQAPSVTPTRATRRSSLFGSFFAPAPPVHVEPEKLVECLTCLDDVPRSKAAKLKCGHRMCRPCLKRIFKLSVTDPQHMPPKCCTADHIPLKHVETLFDNNFKRTWNRKFHEFSTKNRIYCPARRCGEWIKPENIHKEDGKKYGKCSRCKTKVCCLCNGRWHGSKDCPKDEETNKLLETAKQAGWQRCYSCRTMVELKEGCNHMTCRCTAEFCMICGLKWKTCNCPWFNYEAVEADRLNHMQIPVELPPNDLAEERPRRLRRAPRPNTYEEELNERRRQERMDEDIARRLQRVALVDDGDYQGGIGDIHGIGNGAGHFMNQDYVRAAHNILTGNYDQADAAGNYVMGVANARGVPQPPDPGPRRMAERYPMPGRPAGPPSPPPPVLRRHTMREQVYNINARPAERVVPRRSRTDYESEATVHAPPGRRPERSNSRREPRPSVLAGLGGRGNRVSAWRSHVDPGAPEEGVLSI